MEIIESFLSRPTIVVELNTLGSNSVRGWWQVNGQPTLKNSDVIIMADTIYDRSLKRETDWLKRQGCVSIVSASNRVYKSCIIKG